MEMKFNKNRIKDKQLRKIELLEQKIKLLEEENAILLKENESLINGKKGQDEIMSAAEKARTMYEEGLNEIRDYKNKCSEAIRDAQKMQKEYKAKFEYILNNLNKQT